MTGPNAVVLVRGSVQGMTQMLRLVMDGRATITDVWMDGAERAEVEFVIGPPFRIELVGRNPEIIEAGEGEQIRFRYVIWDKP